MSTCLYTGLWVRMSISDRASACFSAFLLLSVHASVWTCTSTFTPGYVCGTLLRRVERVSICVDVRVRFCAIAYVLRVLTIYIIR